MGKILIPEGNVFSEYEMRDASDWVVRKFIDDSVYRERTQAMRNHLGDGKVRNARGECMAVRTLSIPEDEFFALLMQDDPDAFAWWKDPKDKKALRRLVKRFPYWKVSSASF